MIRGTDWVVRNSTRDTASLIVRPPPNAEAGKIISAKGKPFIANGNKK